jgi:hypothetical protein
VEQSRGGGGALSSIGDYQLENGAQLALFGDSSKLKERLRRGNKLKSRCSSASADFSLIARAPGNKGRAALMDYFPSQLRVQLFNSSSNFAKDQDEETSGKILSPYIRQKDI